ncbi:MAG TPA: DUF1175 family protein [Pyrinomonadaceae bacterium]|nr:DUF1175 family protein [Pyrinomonadaceae bacterium]
MRAPLKRWLALASVVIASTTALAWSVSRLHHPRKTEEVSASIKREAGVSTSPSRAGSEITDSDNDGIPDFIELRSFQDRDSFRRWFTAIAETQFYELSDQWNAEQRDCAGLARFAMREALRHHDRIWFQKMGPAYQTVAPDVKSFDLDHNPFGEKIFRTNFGSFAETDIRNDRFSEFADARTLKSFNVVFVSRDRREAQPGDLLFYYQPWVQKFPFHVMIFLGQARVGNNGEQDWVVYHTGSSPVDEGTVKKVELSVLDRHPDPRWRPVERNKNFLGFYRLKILQ